MKTLFALLTFTFIAMAFIAMVQTPVFYFLGGFDSLKISGLVIASTLIGAGITGVVSKKL